MKTETDRGTTIARAIAKKEVIIAMTEKKKAIGFIHGIIHNDILDDAPNLFITLFYVEPAFRNRKIGSSLLHAMISIGISKHVSEIETSTSSANAKRLFQRFGFKQHEGEIFLELDINTYKAIREDVGSETCLLSL